MEITVPGAGSSYSAQKAKYVLQGFFVRYPPIRFSLAHEGTTGATHYATGSYVSGGGTFDTNIFLKKVNDVYKVTELRFESA